MKTQRLPVPPAAAKRRRRENAIIKAMVILASLAYAVFGAAMMLLAAPALQAVETGSVLNATVAGIEILAIYVLAGGALCATFIWQLRRWPQPGRNCAIRGGHFVRTWMWTAPKLLAHLAAGDGMRSVW